MLINNIKESQIKEHLMEETLSCITLIVRQCLQIIQLCEKLPLFGYHDISFKAGITNLLKLM